MTKNYMKFIVQDAVESDLFNLQKIVREVPLPRASNTVKYYDPRALMKNTKRSWEIVHFLKIFPK